MKRLLGLLFLLTSIMLPDTSLAGSEEALRAAKEAAVIQLGLKAEVDKVNAYYYREIDRRLVKKSKALQYLIGAYYVYKEQTVSIKLSKNTRLALYLDKAFITFTF